MSRDYDLLPDFSNPELISEFCIPQTLVWRTGKSCLKRFVVFFPTPRSNDL